MDKKEIGGILSDIEHVAKNHVSDNVPACAIFASLYDLLTLLNAFNI